MLALAVHAALAGGCWLVGKGALVWRGKRSTCCCSWGSVELHWSRADSLPNHHETERMPYLKSAAHRAPACSPASLLPSHTAPTAFPTATNHQLQADVMKPLSIEHLMDNEVQTLSGGAGHCCRAPAIDYGFSLVAV